MLSDRQSEDGSASGRRAAALPRLHSARGPVIGLHKDCWTIGILKELRTSVRVALGLTTIKLLRQFDRSGLYIGFAIYWLYRVVHFTPLLCPIDNEPSIAPPFQSTSHHTSTMPHTRSPPFRRRIYWPSLLSFVALLSTSWLPWTLAQESSAADYIVHSLPGAPDPLLKMWAGHIEVTPEHHGNLFFWLIQNRHIAQRQRTVIWLNGGPGCSSMDGALMEIGPYRVKEDGTLRLNDGSWDEFANVLFIDNPVGTGFSYVDGDALVSDLDEMADQMIQFLEKWFAIFPEYTNGDVRIAFGSIPL